MFEVILSPASAAFYSTADHVLASKLKRCFERLEVSPRQGGNIKRLTGKWKSNSRFRLGDGRVINRIDDATQRVFVVAIAHRREAYD